ncbi:MAG: VWA domain-containing protein [Byssovorax sp.]
MRTSSLLRFASVTLAALALGGCASSGDASSAVGPTGPGSTGISQGGAQDFGLFRQILEAGQIPGPETIDDLGFFAEHKLDFPAPDCGKDICLHGLVGVMGNMITGSTCTLIELGMNSPIDVSKLARPPLNLVIAVDTSGSMAGEPMNDVKLGLKQMIPALMPEDHVSLIKFSSAAHVLLDDADAADTDTLKSAFDALDAAGSTNLYDGLFTAFSLADEHLDPERQNRVIYLSDGKATTGLVSADKLTSLARGYAKKGIGITTIGVGKDFDVEVMRSLGEVGAGNFYFLEDPQAVKEVFADEVKTFLVPVALDATIDLGVGSSYSLRGVYGTHGFTPGEGGGSISIPSLFLAGRTSSEDPIQSGRRGGGGAILFELVPKAPITGAVPVGDVELSYTDPKTGKPVTQKTSIDLPSDEGGKEGYFSHKTAEKSFVMLNIYAGFKLAAQLAADSDPRTARRTLEALRPNVEQWLTTYPDADITDDLKYVNLFIQNLLAVEQTVPLYTPADPPEPWPAD